MKLKSSHRFFIIFFSLSALQHFLGVLFLTHYFEFYPATLSLVFMGGYILFPIGYYISSRKPGSELSFVAWAAYIWLGSSFIAMCTGFLFAMTRWFLPQDWPLNELNLLGVFLVILYSLFRGLQFPRLKYEKIHGPPSLKGLRLIQITDLHMGQLQHTQSWLSKVIQRVNDLNPDFIVLTGDLVEGKLSYVQEHLAPLAQAYAKIDKIYVTGNHEYIHGGSVWEREMSSLGWKVLHNNHHLYQYRGHRLCVAGVPDFSIHRFTDKQRSEPDLALRCPEPVEYKILLAHEPKSVLEIKREKPDLVLTGHTHGGQIFPFNLLVKMDQPIVSGWKSLNGISVYTHEGTGLWGPPMRLGSRNRIVVFDFQ